MRVVRVLLFTDTETAVLRDAWPTTGRRSERDAHAQAVNRMDTRGVREARRWLSKWADEARSKLAEATTHRDRRAARYYRYYLTRATRADRILARALTATTPDHPSTLVQPASPEIRRLSTYSGRHVIL